MGIQTGPKRILPFYMTCSKQFSYKIYANPIFKGIFRKQKRPNIFEHLKSFDET